MKPRSHHTAPKPQPAPRCIITQQSPQPRNCNNMIRLHHDKSNHANVQYPFCINRQPPFCNALMLSLLSLSLLSLPPGLFFRLFYLFLSFLPFSFFYYLFISFFIFSCGEFSYFSLSSFLSLSLFSPSSFFFSLSLFPSSLFVS